MASLHPGRTAQLVLPRELRWFLSLSAVLWVISVGFLLFKLHFDHTPKHDIPDVLTSAPFGDLYAFANRLQFVHEPDFFKPEWGWNYSAPCIFLYQVLYFFCLRRHGHYIYVLLMVVCLSPLLVTMGLALRRRGLSSRGTWLLLVGTLVMSWPIALGVHQGNTDALLWIGAAFGVWAYSRGMWWIAAVAIGLVAAFKIYPVLLIGLFFPPRKYLQAVGAVLTFATVTLASLAYVGPSIPAAYRKISGGIKLLSDLGFYGQDVDWNYLTFEHSIVSLIRVCTVGHLELMRVFFRYYLPVAGGAMAVFFLLLIWKMPRLNQVLVIVLAMVLLPPKSYDYTLEMLYIPWAWLALLCVSAAAAGKTIRGMLPVMVCFALVCAPEFFIKAHGFYAYGQFKTVVLLGMLALAARYRFDEEPVAAEAA